MLTQSELKKIISYDPETGSVVWLQDHGRWDRVKAGSQAGWIDDAGYCRIEIQGKIYKRSRLAWLYMTGEFPVRDLDHKDLNKSNDKWENLREATRPQNVMNAGLRRTNSTGKTGVHRLGSKFIARLGVNSERIYLGSFDTLDAAAAAYNAAAREHFGEFARGE